MKNEEGKKRRAKGIEHGANRSAAKIQPNARHLQRESIGQFAM